MIAKLCSTLRISSADADDTFEPRCWSTAPFGTFRASLSTEDVDDAADSATFDFDPGVIAEDASVVPDGGGTGAERSSFCSVSEPIALFLPEPASCCFLSPAFLAASSPACRMAIVTGVCGPPAALPDFFSSSIAAVGGLEGVTFAEADGVEIFVGPLAPALALTFS